MSATPVTPADRSRGAWVRRTLAVSGSFGVAIGIAAIVLAFALRPLSMALPGAGLDESWITVLGEKAEASARWGVDIAFTYGPASSLITRYFTESYLRNVLPIAIAVALTIGLCVERALATAGARGTRRLVLATLAAVCFVEVHLDLDPLYFALALFVVLLDLVRSDRDWTAVAAVAFGALLMGVAALAKTSFGIAALPLFLLSDLRSIASRRVPILVACFLVGAAATIFSYDQHLADIPSYFRLQWEVAAGYGEAMYVVGDRRELFSFIAAAIALLIAVAVLPRAISRSRRFCGLAALAFILLISVKAGFVRQDNHPQIAWHTLGLAGLCTAFTLVLPGSFARAAVLGAASAAVLWVVAPLFLLPESELPMSLDGLAREYLETAQDASSEVRQWERWSQNPVAFAAAERAEKAAAWRLIAAAHPLPPLGGTVDMLPSEQGAVLANGLDYRPRPSFQEYQTYSDPLVAANASFYAGPSAPDWVIFGIGGLDGRYPNTTEGALWPQLLRRYEPVHAFGDYVALERRAVPLPDVLGPARRVVARLDEPVALSGAAPVFARITVTKTLLGRLAAMVFRPPALVLRVKFNDGLERSYRFIPAIASAGFLLSPMVENGRDFASLGFGWNDPGRSVVEVMIGGGRASGLFYDSAVSFDMQPLQVAPTQPDAGARSLYDDLKARQRWKALVDRLGLGKSLAGEHLAAQPPDAITVPVGGAKRAHLAFGIEDGAWTIGHTQGVCFSIEAKGSGTLWRRCLDPATSSADRGEQTADVAIPPGTTSLLAETTCPRLCDWGWSYWSTMLLEP